MTWRLLELDGVGPARGLAGDEILCRRVGAGQSPASLRLYTYRSHCALVGRFQALAQEVDVEYCASRGIRVNRRPTGGGAILMGDDQLGIALALPGRGNAGSRGSPQYDPRASARELMARFADGILAGLGRLGLDAVFRGKNDVEIGGRKLAGLGIYRDVTGGLLFHGSLLLDLDVPLMAHVLETPFETIGPREIAIIGRRTTTIRRLLGNAVGMTEVRRAIAAGFAESFRVELLPGEFLDDEVAAIEALATDKYSSSTWLNLCTAVTDTHGVASQQTDAGRMEARVAMAGRRFKSVFIHGDFFVDEGALADLEGRLRWHDSEPTAVHATVAQWSTDQPDRLPAEPLARTVLMAAEQATRTEPTPYGCFVSPASKLHDAEARDPAGP